MKCWFSGKKGKEKKETKKSIKEFLSPLLPEETSTKLNNRKTKALF